MRKFESGYAQEDITLMSGEPPVRLFQPPFQ